MTAAKRSHHRGKYTLLRGRPAAPPVIEAVAQVAVGAAMGRANGQG